MPKVFADYILNSNRRLYITLTERGAQFISHNGGIEESHEKKSFDNKRLRDPAY